MDEMVTFNCKCFQSIMLSAPNVRYALSWPATSDFSGSKDIKFCQFSSLQTTNVGFLISRSQVRILHGSQLFSSFFGTLGGYLISCSSIKNYALRSYIIAPLFAMVYVSLSLCFIRLLLLKTVMLANSGTTPEGQQVLRIETIADFRKKRGVMFEFTRPSPAVR
jgi:hypothetical protein